MFLLVRRAFTWMITGNGHNIVIGLKKRENAKHYRQLLWFRASSSDGWETLCAQISFDIQTGRATLVRSKQCVCLVVEIRAISNSKKVFKLVKV